MNTLPRGLPLVKAAWAGAGGGGSVGGVGADFVAPAGKADVLAGGDKIPATAPAW